MAIALFYLCGICFAAEDDEEVEKYHREFTPKEINFSALHKKRKKKLLHFAVDSEWRDRENFFSSC